MTLRINKAFVERFFIGFLLLLFISNPFPKFIQENFNSSFISSTFSQVIVDSSSNNSNEDKDKDEDILLISNNQNAKMSSSLLETKLIDLLGSMKDSNPLKVNDYIEGIRVTSIMGPRNIEGCPTCSRYHTGVDFALNSGTPLAAPGLKGQRIKITKEYQTLGGIVCRVSYIDSISKKVFPVTYTYAHMSQCNVGEYDLPSLIGFSGNTGQATTGPHLHLGMTIEGKLVQVDRVSSAQVLSNSIEIE